MCEMDRSKEKGHGGASHDLNDKTGAGAALLSGDNVPDTHDFVNPQRIAALDSDAAALLNAAHLTPPVLDSKTPPSASHGHAKTLADAIGHLATDKPQRITTPPVLDSKTDELARLRAENARLKRENADWRRTAGLILNDFQRTAAEGFTATVMVVVAAERLYSQKNGGKAFEVEGGADGYCRVRGFGLSDYSVKSAVGRLAAAEVIEWDKGQSRRTPEGPNSHTTEGAYIRIGDLPARLPVLSQTESEAKAAAVKNEQRAQAKRDRAIAEKVKGMICPCCGKTGLDILCTDCGVIVTPDDYQAIIDGAEAPSEAVTVTVERLPAAALLEDTPVLDSKTLSNNLVLESKTPPIEKVINSPIRESVSADGLSLVVTADDVLLVAKASTHIASKLVETVGFNVNTRTELRAKILKITDAPPISNEEAIAIVIELAQRGRYDLAVMVGNAYKLPSATRKELLDQYIEIGSNAA